MNICIVGGGIIGVSTALCLKRNDRSAKVTLIADKLTPETTGDGAAGIWGIYLLKDTPIHQQRQWAKDTHDFIEGLWKTENAGQMGIALVSSIRLNHDPNLVHIWKDIVYGFRQLDDSEVDEFGRLSGRHSHGYQFMTYTIEPIRLLPYLMAEFVALGGVVIGNRRITDLAKLAHDLHADLVINCTGVWASEVTRDNQIAPLRGQVIRVKANWIKNVILDDLDDGNYVISNQDSVVLGGTHQHGDWDTNARDEDAEFIWNGCKALSPNLVEGAKWIKQWVGLRPGRNAVRLERDKVNYEGKSYEVIHNYGHGGSGITLFWGCAQDAYDKYCQVKAELKKMELSRL